MTMKQDPSRTCYDRTQVFRQFWTNGSPINAATPIVQGAQSIEHHDVDAAQCFRFHLRHNNPSQPPPQASTTMPEAHAANHRNRYHVAALSGTLFRDQNRHSSTS